MHPPTSSAQRLGEVCSPWGQKPWLCFLAWGRLSQEGVPTPKGKQPLLGTGAASRGEFLLVWLQHWWLHWQSHGEAGHVEGSSQVLGLSQAWVSAWQGRWPKTTQSHSAAPIVWRLLLPAGSHLGVVSESGSQLQPPRMVRRYSSVSRIKVSPWIPCSLKTWLGSRSGPEGTVPACLAGSLQHSKGSASWGAQGFPEGEEMICAACWKNYQM